MNEGFRITVLYDNHAPDRPGLRSSWGFACAVEGFDRKILFDTGTSGPILLHNMRALGFAPSDFDAVVISHGDWDHLGGLWTFLEENGDVEVFLPASLSEHLKDEVVAHGAHLVCSEADPVEVCPGVLLSGEMPGPRPEQAVRLEGRHCAAVITGCAHPGVERMGERLREGLDPETPLLVAGGFHLAREPLERVEQVIDRLEALGTRWVAPTHCTGETAEALFSTRFGENCFPLRPGSVLEEHRLE